jgi:hypothetical protein
MSPFILPDGLSLALGGNSLVIRHDGDVVLEQSLGRKLSRVEAGGDLTLRFGPITGVLRAEGKLTIEGDVDAQELRADVIELGPHEIKARSIVARTRVTIGRASLDVDVIVAPEVIIDAEATGRVRIVDCLNERPALRVRGCLSLEEFEQDFGGAGEFLARRGVLPINPLPSDTADERGDQLSEDEEEALRLEAEGQRHRGGRSLRLLSTGTSNLPERTVREAGDSGRELRRAHTAHEGGAETARTSARAELRENLERSVERTERTEPTPRSDVLPQRTVAVERALAQAGRGDFAAEVRNRVPSRPVVTQVDPRSNPGPVAGAPEARRPSAPEAEPGPDAASPRRPAPVAAPAAAGQVPAPPPMAPPASETPPAAVSPAQASATAPASAPAQAPAQPRARTPRADLARQDARIRRMAARIVTSYTGDLPPPIREIARVTSGGPVLDLASRLDDLWRDLLLFHGAQGTQPPRPVITGILSINVLMFQ